MASRPKIPARRRVHVARAEAQPNGPPDNASLVQQLAALHEKVALLQATVDALPDWNTRFLTEGDPDDDRARRQLGTTAGQNFCPRTRSWRIDQRRLPYS
jgi:hypothetical protein